MSMGCSRSMKWYNGLFSFYSHSNEAKCFETRYPDTVSGFNAMHNFRMNLQHKRKRSSRLDVAVHKLRKHIQANLVIGHGLDDANGQGKDEGDGHGQ